MGFIKNMIINKRNKKAKIKATNLMSVCYHKAVCSLFGIEEEYKEFFEWIHKEHPDWKYRIDSDSGMTFVYIEKEPDKNGEDNDKSQSSR